MSSHPFSSSSPVSPKAVAIVFFSILLLGLTYVLFMSTSLFGKLQLSEQEIFPKGLQALPNGEKPIFRQALHIQEAISAEVSSPDRRLLLRILEVAGPGLPFASQPDPEAVFHAIRTKSSAQPFPNVAANYLGAHLDMQRGKPQAKEKISVCGKEIEVLPLDENKERHSSLAIVDCQGKQFFVQGVVFSRPVPMKEFAEILGSVVESWG